MWQPGSELKRRGRTQLQVQVNSTTSTLQILTEFQTTTTANDGNTNPTQYPEIELSEMKSILTSLNKLGECHGEVNKPQDDGSSKGTQLSQLQSQIADETKNIIDTVDSINERGPVD